MKPFSLIAALALTAFGTALAHNDTTDATKGSVDHKSGHSEDKHDDHSQSKGHKSKGDHSDTTLTTLTTLESCTIFERFSEIITTATNTTKVHDKFHGNSTRIAHFQDEVAQLKNTSSTKGALYERMRSNVTFTAICESIFATEISEASCRRMLFLERRTTIVANETLLSQVTHGNTTRETELKEEVSKSVTELTILQTNTTLLEFCAVFQTRSDCQEMKKLQAEVNLAHNTTKLSHKLDGNTTRISEYQKQAAKASTKLNKLLSNSTLVSYCKTEMSSTIMGLGGFLLFRLFSHHACVCCLLTIVATMPSNTTVPSASAEAVTKSTASRSTAASAASLVVFFVFSLYLL